MELLVRHIWKRTANAHYTNNFFAIIEIKFINQKFDKFVTKYGKARILLYRMMMALSHVHRMSSF